MLVADYWTIIIQFLEIKDRTSVLLLNQLINNYCKKQPIWDKFVLNSFIFIQNKLDFISRYKVSNQKLKELKFNFKLLRNIELKGLWSDEKLRHFDFTFVEKLCCCDTNLHQLPKLPNVKYLNCSVNDISLLPELPKIEYLNCVGNEIIKLPEMPTIKELYCSNNVLKNIPSIPNVKILYCNSNFIQELPELPNVIILDCSHNKLKRIPELPKCNILYYPRNIISDFKNVGNVFPV